MLFFQQKIRGKWPNICHGNPGWFGQKIRQATMELTTLCLFPSNPFGKIATLPTRWVPTISYRLGVITFGAPINGRKSMGSWGYNPNKQSYNPSYSCYRAHFVVKYLNKSSSSASPPHLFLGITFWNKMLTSLLRLQGSSPLYVLFQLGGSCLFLVLENGFLNRNHSKKKSLEKVGKSTKKTCQLHKRHSPSGPGQVSRTPHGPPKRERCWDAANVAKPAAR